jgi:proteasome lid subunit RPN8/RPN11
LLADMTRERRATGDDRPNGAAPAGAWERIISRQDGRDAVPLREIYRHAVEAYPDECCGFVRASGQVHRAVNNQDALHAEDPVRWPQSARTAYSLAPDDLYALGMSLFAADPAIVVYHSHPNAGAYFSPKDAADALHDGRPIYAVDYLVIDVRRAGPKGAKLFRFMNSRFRCVWSDSV